METMQIEFKPFDKIARLSRDCVVTEKIDGTNAVVHITADGQFLTGSRTCWITPEDDNFGFSKWAHANKDELMKLGEGSHYGEWWGQGIQRGYGLTEKRFSLFNTSRWGEDTKPKCCSVVPVLKIGEFTSTIVSEALEHLKMQGSVAAPGFLKPEGVIVYQIAGRIYFKKTIEKDEEWKGKGK